MNKTNMKKLIFTLIAVLFSATAFAQRTSKMDLDLLRLTQPQDSEQTRAKAITTDKHSAFAKMLQNAEKLNVTPEIVRVAGVLKEGMSVPESELQALGITIEDVTLNIVDMIVPVSKLLDLEQLVAFRSLNKQKGSMLMNRKSHEVEHVDVLQDETQAAKEELPQTYTGEGVVVGVFDLGIDFNHANFRDPETKQTRIKEAIYFPDCQIVGDNFYDMEGNMVQAIDIMKTYTQESDIDTLTTDYTQNSHGTHTAGTAAGSFNGNYVDEVGNVIYTGQRGSAYKANLILAGATLSNLPDQFQRLSLMEMDKYATKENKPLVVNLSLGGSTDWLDDKGEMPQFYKAFTDNGNKPGRIICVASGNDGDTNYCIHKQLDSDNNYELKTFLPVLKVDTDNIIVSIFNNDSTELDFSLAKVDTITGEIKEVTTCEQLKEMDNIMTAIAEDHDNRFYAMLACPFTKEESDPNLAVALIVKSKNHIPCKPRLFCRINNAKASFHSYGLDGYTEGDNKSSLNNYAANDYVLSVGAWMANSTYYSVNNPTQEEYIIYYKWGDKVNDIARFSSFVEADDNGVTRPDVTAPGVCVLSGYNIYDDFFVKKHGTIAGAAKDDVRKDGKQSLLGVMNGTSMACPNVTGIIALWLQANPNLTLNQVREVIKATADKDEFTAASPARFGAGKINALAGLKYILKNYPSSIHKVEGLEESTIQKVMEDGQIILIKNGVKYNVAGQRL